MASIVGIFNTEAEAQRCINELGSGGTETSIQNERTTDGKVRLMVATPDAAAKHVGNILRRCGASEVYVNLEGGVR